MGYKVIVHGLRGEKLMIDLCNTEEQMQRFTVGQLKEKIFEMLPDTAGKLTESFYIKLPNNHLSYLSLWYSEVNNTH